MKNLFDQISLRCSRYTTHAYSTSFSLGIRCLDRSLRNPIYALYGFVRFADEIVDSFHDYDQTELFTKFKEETYLALKNKISLNPILNSFQFTVHKYQLEKELIDSFFRSMEMDLSRKNYSGEELKEYILGSAEVVGLMCLKIFCENQEEQYQKLKPFAMGLGSAFQKINFLRDLNADYEVLGRMYFPNLNVKDFTDEQKKEIEADIEHDFKSAYQGIKMLPRSARFGVYVAYIYYLALFRKIQNTSSSMILKSRIRIPNRHKARLLAYSFFRHRFNLL